MCNWSEAIAERAIEQGIEKGRLDMIRTFLLNKGTEERAAQMLNATPEEIKAAKELLERS